MKTTSWTITTIMVAGIILLQGSRIMKNNDQASVYDGAFVYPATVKTVIDNKCYGCHSVKGKSDDAKKAVMWDSIPNLEKGKLIAKLNNIINVLNDGSMPPEDVVKKYPDAKLLLKERKILKDWAEATADSLLNLSHFDHKYQKQDEGC